LVDTHLLLWWALFSEQVRPATRKRLTSTDPPVLFRVASLWEVAIEAGHVLAVEHLPWIHRDPHRCAEDGVFDRLLVPQA
jgi:PIN domain nuclease of toxin-antitoxin system